MVEKITHKPVNMKKMFRNGTRGDEVERASFAIDDWSDEEDRC
jgi:hypothetical protein